MQYKDLMGHGRFIGLRVSLSRSKAWAVTT